MNARTKICGITADGENANTGEIGGLWAKLKKMDLNLLSGVLAIVRALRSKA